MNHKEKALSNTDKYPGWRNMSSASRRNAKMDKIMEHYREHVEKQRTENPSWHKHYTEHILSKKYKGCTHCK